MPTRTPRQPVPQAELIPAPPPLYSEHRLSVVPRMLFWLAAAFLILTPVIGTIIIDTSGGSHHLALGHFFLVIPASILAISAIALGFVARPGRVVSRSLQTWIFIALSTLLAGVVGTALAPFLAPNPGSVSILGGIDDAVAFLGLTGYIVAFLGLTGYIVAFIGTLIVRARART